MKALRRLPLVMIASLLSIVFSGCTNLQTRMAEFEKLGITEAQITGKFSNTSYSVEEKDGQRVATIDHSNAWMPKVRLVRKTPAEPTAPAP